MGLVNFIERNNLRGSANNKVTIVFDGQVGILDNVVRGWIKVIFSKGESADSKIKSLVQEAANPKNIIVVSDDRDIQYAVRAMGAKICSVKDFTEKANKKVVVDRGKNISKTMEFQINKELSDLWLKKK